MFHTLRTQECQKCQGKQNSGGPNKYLKDQQKQQLPTSSIYVKAWELRAAAKNSWHLAIQEAALKAEYTRCEATKDKRTGKGRPFPKSLPRNLWNRSSSAGAAVKSACQGLACLMMELFKLLSCLCAIRWVFIHLLLCKFLIWGRLRNDR